MQKFPCTAFKQFGDETNEDSLILFAAPAHAIAAWAGIPRKGWHIRMLFQRPVDSGRRSQIAEFWRAASTPNRSRDQHIVRGPNAITVAIQGAAKIDNGHIILEKKDIISFDDPVEKNLGILARCIRLSVEARLTPAQREVLLEFANDPLRSLPTVENDYVFEFALQLVQLDADAAWFIETNGIEEDDLNDLFESMEAITRPAVVVDGQHRLLGAADVVEREILLPVVAMPNCNWSDQVFQFVVINEKAKRVDTSVLTDIFGSSLTSGEQNALRKSLARVRIDIDPRIAAVIADRDDESPFHEMVQIRLDGTPPSESRRFITEQTIRLLVEGGRGARGWRTDEDFYNKCVAPIIPDRSDWDSYARGAWQRYWYAFWNEVGEYYNKQAQLLKGPAEQLWRRDAQTNLTKAVALRTFQTLFIKKAIARIDALDPTTDILIESLGKDQAMLQIDRMRLERALAPSVPEFRQQLRSWFLEKGVPVRFFLANWQKSLDDSEGQQSLYDNMEQAWDNTQKGLRWHARAKGVFEARDDGT